MKIYVDVYLAKNLGDDLFVDILSKRFPKIDFYLNYYGNGYDNFLQKYENIHKSKYPLIFKILNKLKIYDYINDVKRISSQYDAYLFLGGSIFREEDAYWKELYNQRKKMVDEFHKTKKPVFVLGANFGPYKTQEFYDCYYKLFEKCKDVCFRENYSKKLFESLECVRNEDDIIFQLDIPKRKKENTICYSIIDPTHKEGLFFYKRKYIEIIISSIKYNVINGYKCILLSFCENEGDLNVCTEIYKYLPNDISKQVSILNYNGNIFEMLEIISSSKEIISSRFHANILGIISETPIIPFIYSDKTLNVLKDINYNGNIYKIKECDQLSMQNPFNELNQSCDQVKNIEVIKQSSKKQFLEFEKWLKKEKS